MLLSPNYLFSYTPGSKMLGPPEVFRESYRQDSKSQLLIAKRCSRRDTFDLTSNNKEQMDIRTREIVYVLKESNPKHFWSNIAFGPL